VRDEIEAVEGFKWLKRLAEEHGDAHASVIIQPMVITYGYEIAIGAKKILPLAQLFCLVQVEIFWKHWRIIQSDFRL